jgi:cell wall assembly regulator SMI1
VTYAVKLSLNDGATEIALAKAEKQLGFRLPEALNRSLRLHNGQTKDVALGGGLIFGCRLLSLPEIVADRGSLFTDTAWIPITNVSGTQRICTDRSGAIFVLNGLESYKKAPDWGSFLAMCIKET